MAEFAKEISPVNLEDEMRQSYLDYAMSVIVGRALPDVRDGLKPVHRRALFAQTDDQVAAAASGLAAEVDGAGALRKTLHVTVPLMTPAPDRLSPFVRPPLSKVQV